MKNMIRETGRKLLFIDCHPGIRIWMWSAIAAMAYPLLNVLFRGAEVTGTIDAALMAYGIGSLAIYLLIYGFDWKQ